MPFTEARRLIAEAAAAGVALRVLGGEVSYSASGSEIPAGLRLRLQSLKDDLIAELSLPRFQAGEREADVLRLPHLTGHTLGWYLETQVNNVAANITHIAWKIRGADAVSRFHAAVRGAVARHDVLEARVVLRDGVPHMKFATGYEIVRSEVHVDSGTSQVVARRLLAEVIWAPFEDGAVFRPFIIEMSADECLCGFVLSHFIVDLNACDILAQELYQGLRDVQSALARPQRCPLQYPDYIRGMVEWFAGPGVPYRLEYWRRQMSGAPAVCLPNAMDVSPTHAGRLGTVEFLVSPDLRSALAEAARSCGVTLARVVLAAKLIALAGILRQEDLVVVAIVSGRDDAALLRFVGNTADCVPLRVSVDPTRTLAELIEQLQAVYALACRYRVRWELLLEIFDAVGASAVAPTFNFIRAGLTCPHRGERPAAPALAVERAPSVGQPAQLGNASQHTSHNMHLFDTGQCLRGHVKYMMARYGEEHISAFVSRFITCLRRVAINPREIIGNIMP